MATDVTIAAAARNAGFPQDQLKTAVMVALAESGGNEFATNHNSNGTVDYGLWQINSVHTDALKLGDWRSPTVNAQMAHLVFTQAKSWSPWVTYKNNAYLKFEARAGTAVTALGLFQDAINGVTAGAQGNIQDPSTTSAIDTITNFFHFISDKHNWVRLGMILVGLLLINSVVFALLKEAGVVDGVAKTVGAVKGLVL